MAGSGFADAPDARLVLRDEAVHPAAIDVRDGSRHIVGAPNVSVRGTMERPHAGVGIGIGEAHGGDPVLHRDPVGSRVGAEVMVEGAVLLHDHDDVLDLADTVQLGALPTRGRGRLSPGT